MPKKIFTLDWPDSISSNLYDEKYAIMFDIRAEYLYEWLGMLMLLRNEMADEVNLCDKKHGKKARFKLREYFPHDKKKKGKRPKASRSRRLIEADEKGKSWTISINPNEIGLMIGWTLDCVVAENQNDPPDLELECENGDVYFGVNSGMQ